MSRQPRLARLLRCESCDRRADVTLPDGSHWCQACDDGAHDAGYDHADECECDNCDWKHS